MKKWVTKPCYADVQKVAKRYRIDPIFAEVLVKRGLSSWSEMDGYLFADMSQEGQPEQMCGIVQTSEILFSKIQQQEPIRIIGDYDADGIMSTFILCHGLKRLGAVVSYLLPHRERDGYGMREYMVEDAFREGIRTLITCDNGISAMEAICKAKELGMTVLLTDHHEVPMENGTEILPPADVIVDPKQAKETYYFRDLCGAGVVYKLMEYMYRKMQISQEVTQLLPFVAIATVCDVVPLQGENRILVKKGLEAIRITENRGLKALKEQLQFEKEIYAADLGFRIGPCINAPGRLEDATMSLQLFLETDESAAKKQAARLVEINEERKEITKIATEKAIKEVEAEKLPKVLVVYLPECPESVAGIVAGRLREKYYRPTYVITQGKNGLKGSGRSIPGYHMQQQLQDAKEYLEEFGGHALAAGFSLKKENLSPFREKLLQQCDLPEEVFIEKVYFDKVISLRDVTPELVQQLQWIEPIGADNRGPVFAKANATIASVRMCGKYMHIAQIQFEEEGNYYGAVDFSGEEGIGKAVSDRYGAEAWEKLKSGHGKTKYQIDILFVPEINERYGSLQLQLIDCQ